MHHLRHDLFIVADAGPNNFETIPGIVDLSLSYIFVVQCVAFAHQYKDLKSVDISEQKSVLWNNSMRFPF